MEVNIRETLKTVIAFTTFGVWVASVVAFLFYRVPVDPWVHILTAAIFSFLFGPEVFKKNGRDTRK